MRLHLQTSINVDGFRSLREGERVEFDLEISEDGRAKAMNVTGPGGEAPQVSNSSLLKAPSTLYERLLGQSY